jgi:hypothetical protein
LPSKTAGTWIGIDLHPGYCEIARNRIQYDEADPHAIMLEKPRVRAAESSRQLEFFNGSQKSKFEQENQ